VAAPALKNARTGAATEGRPYKLALEIVVPVEFVQQAMQDEEGFTPEGPISELVLVDPDNLFLELRKVSSRN